VGPRLARFARFPEPPDAPAPGDAGPMASPRRRPRGAKPGSLESLANLKTCRRARPGASVGGRGAAPPLPRSGHLCGGRGAGAWLPPWGARASPRARGKCVRWGRRREVFRGRRQRADSRIAGPPIFYLFLHFESPTQAPFGARGPTAVRSKRTAFGSAHSCWPRSARSGSWPSP